MNFRPTKWKVIVSIIVIVLWYLYYVFLIPVAMCDCYFPDVPPCPEGFKFHILPDKICTCGCVYPISLSDIINDLSVLLGPGLFVYILWSSFQKKGKIKRGKKS